MSSDEASSSTTAAPATKDRISSPSSSSLLSDASDGGDKSKGKAKAQQANGSSESKDGIVMILSDSELSDVEDDVQLVGDARENAAKKLNDFIKSSSADHPKNRWETAYIYAFLDRFTSIQQDSAYAPQTIIEFEAALLTGGAPIMPESADENWITSLEPIVRDLTDRVKQADIAKGGTGGMRGGWQLFLPWWVNDQKSLGLPDFQMQETPWNKAIAAMREDREHGFYKLDWEKKLIILKALIDNIVCFSPEIHTYINECYGAVVPPKKEQVKAKGKDATANGKDAEKEKKDEKAKGKGKEKATESKIAPSINPLPIKPFGKDSAKRLWYRFDDSPRVYVNENPIRANARWVAVSDGAEDLQKLLLSLHSSVTKGKSNDPFSKAKKTKEPSEKTRWQRIEEELHACIQDDILAGLSAEDTGYDSRMSKLTARRSNLVKKRDREARQAVLADEREASRLQGQENLGTRQSTRLRRGRQPDANGQHGYSERMHDRAIERALQDFEAERMDSDEEYDEKPRKRRRTVSEDDEGGDYKERGSEDEQDDEDHESESEEDEEEEDGLRRSRRSARNGGRHQNGRASIPGERRSGRTRHSLRRDSTPPVQVAIGPSIVRTYSPAKERNPDGPKTTAGVEEVWSINKYKGYHLHGVFHKAHKGDIPPYKLAIMGLPLPGEPGYSRTGKKLEEDAETQQDGDAKTAAAPDMRATPSVPGSAVPTLLEGGEGPTDESMQTSEGEDEASKQNGYSKVGKSSNATRMQEDEQEMETSSDDEGVVRVTSARSDSKPIVKKQSNIVVLV